jgi:hypothetical protein
LEITNIGKLSTDFADFFPNLCNLRHLWIISNNVYYSHEKICMTIQKPRPTVLVISILMTLALSACGSAAPTQSVPSVQDTAATLVALTFQAATQSAVNNPPTPLPAATATMAPPRLYVNADVKCRSGIGSNFRVVVSFPAPTTVDMIAKDSADAAWLVQVPNSTDSCWVQAQESSPSGSFQALPEMTPQPSTEQLPSAPIALSYPFFCAYEQGLLYKVTIKLSWTNTAKDANGFRVYRENVLVTELPADTTSFTDNADVQIGSSLTYSVEAYNDAGASPRLVQTISSICK